MEKNNVALAIRSARAEDAPYLTDIAIRSKAYCPYDASFIEICKDDLTINPIYASSGNAFVAVAHEKLVGFYEFSQKATPPEMTSLFVDPDFIGKGIGHRLWSHAVEFARSKGWPFFLMAADPYAAEKFYYRVGCYKIGEVESSALKGRLVPKLRYDIQSSEHFGLPFDTHEKVFVIAPTDFSKIPEADVHQAKEFQRLIEEHQNGIQRELGSTLEFSQTLEASQKARWLIGPYDTNPIINKFKTSLPDGPEIYIDRKNGLLISDGRTPEEVMETFSWLRSLGKIKDGLWKIKNCETIDGAIERVRNEIETSFPAFNLHKLNWEQICRKHIPLVKSASDPIPALQRWLAELGDAHTWVRPIPAYGQFPYDLQINVGRALFYRVADNSLAWEKGVRPGFELVDENVADWWARTSASPHGKPFIAGAKLLATPLESARKFKARSPAGKIIEWEEKPVVNRWAPLVKWKILDSGVAYLRIEAWMVGLGLEEEVERAFENFKSAPKLIVDLRANPGGNLLMAHRFRNRFLQKDGPVGWMRTTLPDGTLGEREPIVGKMVDHEKRWLKPAIFLTDPLTYSAAEDVLLGLQGQSNVKVIGQRSGGGSGRVRILKLLEGWRLTISTALTYDLSDHCIEGSGIPVDHQYPISFDPNELIAEADRL